MTQRSQEALLHEYDGGWCLGLKNGVGKLIDHRTGLTFRGDWVQDHRLGRGIMEVPTCLVEDFGYKRYEGEWKNDRRHGVGTMRLKNDMEYEGEFRNNVRQGFGALREPQQEHTEMVCAYATKEHAENDLVRLVGGEGKYVFVEKIWKAKKSEEKKKGTWKLSKKEHVEVEKAPGCGTAFDAGVRGGMYIVSINGQDEFSRGPLSEIWAACDGAISITFARMQDTMYNGYWLR